MQPTACPERSLRAQAVGDEAKRGNEPHRGERKYAGEELHRSFGAKTAPQDDQARGALEEERKTMSPEK
jgi:hypothetical protein